MGWLKDKIVKPLKKAVKSVAKGVKSVVKKIGSTIKSAVKSVGKFMNKIGIVGQIAMSFILPGIGGALLKGIGGTLGKFVSTMAASANPFVAGAGKVLQAAGNFAKAGHSAFKTVTEGIGSFVKEFTGTALKKIPGMEKLMPKLSNSSDSFFSGPDSAWGRTQANVMSNGAEVVENFNKAIGYTPKAPLPTTTPPKLLAKKPVVDATGQAPQTPKVSVEVPNEILEVKGLDGKPLKESMLGDLGKAPTVSTDGKITSLLDSQQGLGQSAAPSVLQPDNVITQGAQSVVGEGVTAKAAEEVVEDGFFTRLGKSTKDAIKSIPDKIVEAPGRFVDEIDDTVQSSLQTVAMQKIGLEEEPVYNITETQNVFSPAPVQMLSPGSYNSAEINDRAYQMSINPTNFSMGNPWGSPANTYQKELGARYYG